MEAGVPWLISSEVCAWERLRVEGRGACFLAGLVLVLGLWFHRAELSQCCVHYSSHRIHFRENTQRVDVGKGSTHTAHARFAR